ncbi:MAG: hypothetical protein JRJ47_01805 [Deltaproteobacteria bacterium]|nr:hypothetical protein [Deltaproteobacteria bacterium]
MDSSNRIVRVAASAAAAFISSVFVSLYNAVEVNNAHWQGIELPNLTAFYAWASPWGLAIPAAVFLAGIGCFRLRTRPDLILNIVSYSGWLYALAWSLGCILAWELPYVIIDTEIK